MFDVDFTCWIWEIDARVAFLHLFVDWAARELEKDAMELSSDSLTTDKKLAVYDKIFIAYQDAKRHIRDDLVGGFTLLHYVV